jgi:hypothetical protein
MFPRDEQHLARPSAEWSRRKAVIGLFDNQSFPRAQLSESGCGIQPDTMLTACSPPILST